MQALEIRCGFRNRNWKNVFSGYGFNKITNDGLVPIVDSFPKAFLVEQFDKIYIEEAKPAGFTRGLSQFIEKEILILSRSLNF